MDPARARLLRQLPQVDELLRHPTLLPAVTPENLRRFAFATDDRHPADLIEAGSIDNNVREAIAAGLELRKTS